MLIEAIVSAKKRHETAALPQLICYRCKQRVKNETDVFHALRTRFKVKNIKKIGA